MDFPNLSHRERRGEGMPICPEELAGQKGIKGDILEWHEVKL